MSIESLIHKLRSVSMSSGHYPTISQDLDHLRRNVESITDMMLKDLQDIQDYRNDAFKGE